MSEWSALTLEILGAARRGDFLTAFRRLKEARTQLPTWEFIQAEMMVSVLGGFFGRALAAIDAGCEELAEQPRHLVIHCLNSAWALLRYGDVCRTEDMVLLGLTTVQAHRDDAAVAHWEGRLLLNFAEVAYALGQYEVAYDRYRAGEVAIMACTHPFEVETRSCTVPLARAGAGMCAYRLGWTEQARSLLGSLDGLAPESAGVGLVARAALALLDGQAAEAFSLAQQARRLAMEDRMVQIEAQRLEAEAQQRHGRTVEPEQLVAYALRML